MNEFDEFELEDNYAEVEKEKKEAKAFEEYKHDMLEAYIGTPEKPEKVDWYEEAFRDLEYGKWKWSWWAFLSGYLFLLYRKQYLLSLMLLLLSIITAIIPGAGLVLVIMAGGFSVHFIRADFIEKGKLIEEKYSTSEERIDKMREIGGKNNWVIWLSAFLAVSFISLFGIVFFLHGQAV